MSAFPLTAPPVCGNCRRVVDLTRRVSIFVDGAAPWIQSAPAPVKA